MAILGILAQSERVAVRCLQGPDGARGPHPILRDSPHTTTEAESNGPKSAILGCTSNAGIPQARAQKETYKFSTRRFFVIADMASVFSPLLRAARLV